MYSTRTSRCASARSSALVVARRDAHQAEERQARLGASARRSARSSTSRRPPAVPADPGRALARGWSPSVARDARASARRVGPPLLAPASTASCRSRARCPRSPRRRSSSAASACVRSSAASRSARPRSSRRWPSAARRRSSLGGAMGMRVFAVANAPRVPVDRPHGARQEVTRQCQNKFPPPRYPSTAKPRTKLT